jgi:hypothetical protein
MPVEGVMLSVVMAVLASLMASLLRGNQAGLSWHQAFPRALLFWSVGVQSLLTAYAHTGLAHVMAHALGWPSGSPFQWELAMAHLSFGFLGIMGEWFPGLRLPTTVGYSIFAIGRTTGYFLRLAHGFPTPTFLTIDTWIAGIAVPITLLIMAAWKRSGSDSHSSEHHSY